MTDLLSNTDHGVRSAIIEELGWTPNVNADHIGVSVLDGTATVSGHVTDYPEKRAAINAVLRVRGVGAVADQIVVQRTTGPRTDAVIAHDAVDVLAKNAVVPPGAVHAVVNDHVVTLTGLVGWEYERHAAQVAISTVRGVVSVVNQIGLEPPVVISATEAWDNITRALLRNARVDAERIEVFVDGSKIRLTGKVTSWAERHQAEYAGWSTPGVTHVDNQLQIVGSA